MSSTSRGQRRDVRPGWSRGFLSGVGLHTYPEYGASGITRGAHGTPRSLHRLGLCLLRWWQLPGAVPRQLLPIDSRRPRVSIESPSLWAAHCANTRLSAAAPGAALLLAAGARTSGVTPSSTLQISRGAARGEDTHPRPYQPHHPALTQFPTQKAAPGSIGPQRREGAQCSSLSHLLLPFPL